MADLKADDTGNAIVPVLACVLNQLCLRNDRLPMNQKGLSKFHALRPPAISIKDYLQRVAKYAACSGECFVLALVYIDRIIQSNPTFVVNSLNIHRLLITSIMLAAKFFDDQYFNNAYYAKVGGVPCNEINSLEVEFLFMCNFTLFVTTDTYSQYYTELCNHAANTSNVCNCSQGPKVPQLVIPYVNAPGPGQTLQEWMASQQPSAQYALQHNQHFQQQQFQPSGDGMNTDDPQYYGMQSGGAQPTYDPQQYYAQHPSVNHSSLPKSTPPNYYQQQFNPPTQSQHIQNPPARTQQTDQNMASSPPVNVR